MPASVPLRACMTGLVLLNLVFVQLTGATSLHWLLPLYGLTAVAPFVVRFRSHVVYRFVWNAGVLAVFAQLVSHATGEQLRYVLEDGLVLAVLCQVHLINNLRSEQRPDLLFLNAFLIAIITGYLSRDLAFFAAFLLFVPLFVVGLQLWCVAQRSGGPDPGATRPIVLDGLRRAAWLLGACVVVFLFWPRDFERRGLIVMTDFDFSSSGGDQEIGFSNELKLERAGATRVSDRVVMTVELVRGASGDVPAHWRGAVLTGSNGTEWWPPASHDATFPDLRDEAWGESGGGLVRAGAARGPELRVQHVDPEANVLFAPLGANRLRYGQSIDPLRVRTSPGAIVRYGVPNLVRPDLGYDLVLGRERPRLGGSVEEHAGDTTPYTALPTSRKTLLAQSLANALVDEWPYPGDQHELVRLYRDHLARTFEYLPPGADGAAGSLDEFLSGAAGGHCEFFASALATMLRLVDVPCRVVTGYRSHDWDESGRLLTFRRRDAHAWVEVLDPAGGWYVVDPTPPASLEARVSLWRTLEDRIGAFWAELSTFDEEGRHAAFVWLAGLPRRAAGWSARHPWQALGWGGLVASLIGGLVVRRRRRTTPSLRRYRRALRRARLELAPGETPRELTQRARRSGLRAERLAELERATDEHEAARYAA